jgi:hypothetical protein
VINVFFTLTIPAGRWGIFDLSFSAFFENLASHDVSSSTLQGIADWYRSGRCVVIRYGAIRVFLFRVVDNVMQCNWTRVMILQFNLLVLYPVFSLFVACLCLQPQASAQYIN